MNSKSTEENISNNIKNPSRLEYLDSLKGFGIILVLLGHTYSAPDFIRSFIYSFHMPLFFIIFGFLYNESKYKNVAFTAYFKKRFCRFIIPYFVLSGINLVLQMLWLAVLEHYSFDKLTEQLWIYIKGIIYSNCVIEYTPNCSPLWFLTCIFLVSLLIYFVCKISQKRLQVMLILISAAIGAFFGCYNEVVLPWNLHVAFTALPFVYIGVCLNRISLFDSLNTFKKTALALALFAVGFAAFLFNGKVDMHTNVYNILPLFYIAAVGISTAVMILFKNAAIFNSRALRFYGTNSVLFFGFNYFFISLTTEIYYLCPIIKNYKLNWFVSFLMVVVSMTAAVLLYNFIKQKIKSKNA